MDGCAILWRDKAGLQIALKVLLHCEKLVCPLLFAISIDGSRYQCPSFLGYQEQDWYRSKK